MDGAKGAREGELSDEAALVTWRRRKAISKGQAAEPIVSLPTPVIDHLASDGNAPRYRRGREGFERQMHNRRKGAVTGAFCSK
jgi:hypothetical protein